MATIAYFTGMIAREKALELVNTHVKTRNIVKHLLATEALMRSLARRFGENEDRWGLAGLLHDLDWDYTKPTPEKHGLKSFEMLASEDIDDEMRSAIKIHNYVLGIEPRTLLEKALYCSEMMTGFIVAVTLVQPSKKLADVSVDSIMRKYKEKSFAAGARREIMNRCEEFLGFPVSELAQICLKAMHGISGELGL